MSIFPEVPSKFDLVGEEVAVLKYWEKINAFLTSVRRSQDEGRPEFSFYDGPPFATGLPHYGHLLAGTIKDTVCRFKHMCGFHVERRFGWDCHGLPVEFEIDNELQIKSREDVLKMGIAAYNDKCRSIVMRYAEQWRVIVTRMGRWIDFDNDYKTMNPEFMESVWWVFKTMFEKGLIYKGFKVMPYSTACHTPLSNFEAGQNYKDVHDPVVYVTFPLVDEPNTHVIAWTTTPWTLPSNLALCVHPEMIYVTVLDKVDGKQYVVAKDRLSEVYPAKKKSDGAEEESGYTVVAEYPGATLAGRRYQPLFPYFAAKSPEFFRIVVDTYVTADSGTGVVHQAPAFGEDDYRICLANGIIQRGPDLPCPVDADGRFTSEVSDFAGVHVKEADKDIIAMLKSMGRLVRHGSIVHSYPHCWRSDKPLIYKAVASWFVDVPRLKERLLANNAATYWVPAFVSEKRFANWLEQAREWAISRNRFWGTPLPIWASEDGEEVVVIGSIAELEELTGTKVADLHREHIDDLLIPSRRGKGMLKRVDEVFDCWFESGSMPYAQMHYPFEGKERFEHNYFPADFIAEGLDQTRGWFYTLLVISTALFDKPPFKNLIVNGLVLAGDGQKMSKRKKNYPDPMTEIVDEYGADALRLYLVDSPAVRAEPLKFMKSGVLAMVKSVINPYINAYKFFVEYANTSDQTTYGDVDPAVVTNLTDRWIMSALHSLVRGVRAEMEAYHLYTVVPKITRFLEALTNWWLRLNRLRLKGKAGAAEASVSLAVLYNILFTLAKLLAPFAPFVAEMVYLNLRHGLPEDMREDSVHYLSMPTVNEAFLDAEVEGAMDAMRDVIETVRLVRDREKRPAKYPLRKLIVVHTSLAYLAAMRIADDYIRSEGNVDEVVYATDFAKYVTFRAEPLGKSLGPKLGKDLKSVSAEIRAMSSDECVAFQSSGTAHVGGVDIVREDVSLHLDVLPELIADGTLRAETTPCGTVVVVDVAPDEELWKKGVARELLSKVQRLRKKAGLQVSDRVAVYVHGTSGDMDALSDIIRRSSDLFQTGLDYVPCVALPPQRVHVFIDEEHEVADWQVRVALTAVQH